MSEDNMFEDKAKPEDLTDFEKATIQPVVLTCNQCHKSFGKADYEHERYTLLLHFASKTHKLDFCDLLCLQNYVEGLV